MPLFPSVYAESMEERVTQWTPQGHGSRTKDMLADDDLLAKLSVAVDEEDEEVSRIVPASTPSTATSTPTPPYHSAGPKQRAKSSMTMAPTAEETAPDDHPTRPDSVCGVASARGPGNANVRWRMATDNQRPASSAYSARAPRKGNGKNALPPMSSASPKSEARPTHSNTQDTPTQSTVSKSSQASPVVQPSKRRLQQQPSQQSSSNASFSDGQRKKPQHLPQDPALQAVARKLNKALVAHAQKRQSDGPPSWARFFMEADTDGSGMISFEELDIAGLGQMVLIEEHEDPELPMPATLHELISSDDDDGNGRPGRDEQPQPHATAQEGALAELQPEAFCHSEELRQALDHLARAQRVLCTITSDVVVDGLERLHAVKRTLQEDLEMATSVTVNDRLQVLLKLHAQALEECRCADEKCEAEQPEILMLRRSIAETSRRMPRIRENPDVGETSLQEAPQHSAVPRSGRLAALQQALALRSRQAQIAKGSLLSEDKLLSAELNVAKNALKEAVMEGQRLEEMKDEAEAEVFRACRALASVEDKGEGDGESVKNIPRNVYQKAREVEAFVAKGPAAPWRLSALHQPSGTGSIGTTAALLDPEAYRLNREKATAQADKDLEAMIEAYVAEKEQIQRAVHEEVQRQKDEEAHFAAELQSLREHIKERRHGIDTALAAQSSEKDQRLLEAQRQLTLELRQIESQERSNQLHGQTRVQRVQGLLLCMKSFDAFARPVQEFQVKTAVGGYISIGSICLVAALFLSELRYFLTLETKDEMLIDQSQERKYLNMSLDVTFSSLPCSVLGVNLLDPKQNNVMHVAHEIFKERLTSTGEVIGKPIRDGLQNVAMTPADLATVFRDQQVKANHSSTHFRCPSCFQSLFDEDSCCNSCKEVREAFLNHGWDDRPDDYVFYQCIDEAYQRTAAQIGEGCRLKAHLHVRKVPATLHIGISQRIRRDLVRATSVAELTVGADFTHHIHSLSFGPDFPGLVRVLDGRQKSSHQPPMSEHYQYDVHVIPTRYLEDGSDEIAGHQYSVTEYVKTVDATHPGHEVATTGIWMSYDFTPFEEALRQEVRKARQRLAQAAACAKQQLDLRLAKVRTDCCEMLRSTAMQWERAVVRERQALQEAKERREHWQKRLKSSKDAFRGHCVKTGVYARTLDSTRRRILDSLVPRAKVGDVYSWDPKS
ncbi:ergic3 [Symbiodinium sp. CCMP2456]|nr:ergic3 [Symbiodinium sp. CCMP2456]